MGLYRYILVFLSALVFSTCSGNTVARFGAINNDVTENQIEEHATDDYTQTVISKMITQDSQMTELPVIYSHSRSTASIKDEHTSTKTPEIKSNNLKPTRLSLQNDEVTKKLPKSSHPTKVFSKAGYQKKTPATSETNSKSTRGTVFVSKQTSVITPMDNTKPSRSSNSKNTYSRDSASTTITPLSTRKRTLHSRSTLFTFPPVSSSKVASTTSILSTITSASSSTFPPVTSSFTAKSTISILSTRKSTSSSTLFTFPPVPSSATATSKPPSNNHQLKRIAVILLAILIVSLAILFVIVWRGGCFKRSRRHHHGDSSPAYYELKNVHI